MRQRGGGGLRLHARRWRERPLGLRSHGLRPLRPRPLDLRPLRLRPHGLRPHGLRWLAGAASLGLTLALLLTACGGKVGQQTTGGEVANHQGTQPAGGGSNAGGNGGGSSEGDNGGSTGADSGKGSSTSDSTGTGASDGPGSAKDGGTASGSGVGSGADSGNDASEATDSSTAGGSNAGNAAGAGTTEGGGSSPMAGSTTVVHVSRDDYPTADMSEWVEVNREYRGVYFYTVGSTRYVLVTRGESPNSGYGIRVASYTEVIPPATGSGTATGSGSGGFGRAGGAVQQPRAGEDVHPGDQLPV